MDVRRTDIVIRPNIARVIFRSFEISSPERTLKIIGRVMALSEVSDFPPPTEPPRCPSGYDAPTVARSAARRA